MTKDIISSYVNLPECEKLPFCEWAFGDYCYEVNDPIYFMKKWNMFHGNELKLDEEGNISEDIKLMIELWKSTRCIKK